MDHHDDDGDDEDGDDDITVEHSLKVPAKSCRFAGSKVASLPLDSPPSKKDAGVFQGIVNSN